ncbi:IQ domain-containing protein IQM2 [Bienertia sinuspersici]
MGISMSCPFGSYNDLESGLQSIIVKSVCLGDEQVKTPERCISFKDKDVNDDDDDESQSMIVKKSLGSGKMIIEGRVSFKKRESDTLISVIPSPLSIEKEKDDCFWNGSPKDQAAVKLQKVYKSFRTRRKLADCAVVVEKSWWELLDSVELKHSSISFFEIEHHETAISRWSRAKTRAAKLGKGLIKNDKAQKLALQHWLEAIDPRHRYGHNLHFYYSKWLESQCREPFFYWLDIGEGREVTSERCSRMKLQQQCIKYLGPMERMAYEVIIENKRFVHKESGKLLDTSTDINAKWIFVLSTSKNLYVGKKKKGTFQHSSFLAGGATLAAGRLVVENGFLKAVWPHSGHYRPTPENFQEFMSFLGEYNVDVADVKLDPVDEDDQHLGKQRSSLHWRNNSSEEDLVTEAVENNSINIDTAKIAILEQNTVVAPDHLGQSHSGRFSRKITKLQIPRKDDLIVTMLSENLAPKLNEDNLNVDNSDDSAIEEASTSEQDDQVETKDMLVEDNEEEEEEEVDVIPEESILQRINSHKEMKSYQLGKQLSCRWTTGAGPRIGCVRDYPSGLQSRALEQVNLSPRSACALTKSWFSPRFGAESSPKASTPIPIVSRRSIGHCRMQLSPLCKGGKRTL